MRRASASLLVALLFGGLLSSAWGQIARQPTPVRLGITAPGCSTEPSAQPPEGYEVVIEELHQVTCQGSRIPSPQAVLRRLLVVPDPRLATGMLIVAMRR